GQSGGVESAGRSFSPEVFRSRAANGSAGVGIGRQGSGEARATIAERDFRSAIVAERTRAVSRPGTAAKRSDFASAQDLDRRRCAGADGSGDAVAQPERLDCEGGEPAGGNGDVDGRKSYQREGRMVAGGRQHRGEAGREDGNADARDARRQTDRDVASGGRAPADLRRGDSKNGF